MSLANHALVKQIDGSLDYEIGTTAWWAVRKNKAYGDIPASLYDHKWISHAEYLNFLKKPIPLKVLNRIKDTRSEFYERLYDVKDISETLKWVGACIVCFRIFENIVVNKNGLIPLPDLKDKNIGCHAVTFVSYDEEKKLFKFRNSWGPDWGENGFGFISSQYLEAFLVEAWVDWLPVGGSRLLNKVTIYKNSFEYVNKRYLSILKSRDDLYSLEVFDREDIIAWVHYRINKSESALRIEDLYVINKFRRRGIGSKLINCIEHIAISNKLKKIITYIYAQDLLSQENIDSLEKIFSNNYNFFLDSKFPGCVYLVVGYL